MEKKSIYLDASLMVGKGLKWLSTVSRYIIGPNVNSVVIAARSQILTVWIPFQASYLLLVFNKLIAFSKILAYLDSPWRQSDFSLEHQS